MRRAITAAALLSSLAAGGCGSGEKPSLEGSSDSSGISAIRNYSPSDRIGLPQTPSAPRNDHGWLSVVNRSGHSTDCLVDGYFETPFNIDNGGSLWLQPGSAGTIAWVACGGDPSRQGFPGAVAFEMFGSWDTARSNAELVFLGETFTLSFD